MTKDDWFQCNDAAIMIQYLWTREPFHSIAEKFKNYPNSEDFTDYQNITLPLYKYYLACCREIWLLLPQEESKKGIRLAEQYIDGRVSWDKISEYNWDVEAAAFTFEYDSEPEKIKTWVKEAESFSGELISKILNNDDNKKKIDTRSLLMDAAYFADYAMIYPSIQPMGLPSSSYHKFLFHDLLREYVEYPL